MKRKALKVEKPAQVGESTEDSKQPLPPKMSLQNLKICIENQEGYHTLHLNNSLQLHYYGFETIENLEHSVNPKLRDNNSELLQQHESRGVNTLYLNNNILQNIPQKSLICLRESLVTLNLSHNRLQSLQGLSELNRLKVLDLSHNKLNCIRKSWTKGLDSLEQINLSSNPLLSWRQLKGLFIVCQTLQVLNLSVCTQFQEDPRIIDEFIKKFEKLQILSLKDTPYARKTPSYRKQMIYALKSSLTYLDDRPVTEEEKFMVRAWKEGGLEHEKEARKQLNFKKQEKNNKIYEEIQLRNKAVDEKVDKVFAIKSADIQKQLQKLKEIKQSEEFDLFTTEEVNLHRLKIEEIEKYLQILKEECRGLDLDSELGLNKNEVPSMVIDKRLPDCILVYNVKEEQLEGIKKKFYPNEQLPLKAVNYEKKPEPRYLDLDYTPILKDLLRVHHGDWEMTTVLFNMEIYEFDQKASRKLRRFTVEELQEKMQDANNYASSSEANSESTADNVLDSLD